MNERSFIFGSIIWKHHMTMSQATKGERTKELISTAALRLFRQKGYHGTSMRAIAQEAGMAVGGIYNHFSGKEDIFREVLYNYHPYKAVIPALQEAQGNTLEELIQDAARRMVVGFGLPVDFLNLVFIELVEFNGQHIPELFNAIYPQLMEFGQRLHQEPEELRPIPLPVLLRSFIGLFFSYVMTDSILARYMPSEMKEHAFEDFVDIYLHGILKQRA
jgi:AcrR family transcriptional regulator